MALTASCQIEIRTTGSDTICSGAFDPTQTAGMFTDGAATSANTSAPVFTSASYTFVAGDVDAYVFIGAGTNWTRGWYKIVSVNAGAATLSATAGGYQPYAGSTNTSAGCASVASPTGATWSIDYSQQNAAEFSCTDGTAAGAGSTLSSATIGFGQQMVGNAVRITAGTNCTAGHHVITSVAAGVATFNNAVTTGATADCTLYLGGALATPGYMCAIAINGNIAWAQTGTFEQTTNSISVAAGMASYPAGSVTLKFRMSGYGTVRGDSGKARFKFATALTPTQSLIRVSSYSLTTNIIFDCNSKGIGPVANQTGGSNYFYDCEFTAYGSGARFACNAVSPWLFVRCRWYSNGGSNGCLEPQARAVYLWDCSFIGNTNTGGGIVGVASQLVAIRCLFAGNSGPGIDTTAVTGNGVQLYISSCTFYGNTGAGLRIRSTGSFIVNIKDNIFESNTTYGIHADSNQNIEIGLVENNAFFGNSSGAYSTLPLGSIGVLGNVICTESILANPASGDYSPNTKSDGGRRIRAASVDIPGLSYPDRRDIGALQHGGRRHGDLDG